MVEFVVLFLFLLALALGALAFGSDSRKYDRPNWW